MINLNDFPHQGWEPGGGGSAEGGAEPDLQEDAVRQEPHAGYIKTIGLEPLSISVLLLFFHTYVYHDGLLRRTIFKMY